MYPEQYSDDDREDVPGWMLNQINLYRRCRDFNDINLPNEGGILHQDEFTMQCFTIIHHSFNNAHNEKVEDAIRSVENKIKTSRVSDSRRR